MARHTYVEMNNTLNALNVGGPKVDKAVFTDLTQGDDAIIVKDKKSGAWGLSAKTYEAAMKASKEGNEGATKLIAAAKEQRKLAKDGNLPKKDAKADKENTVSYADQAIALKAANDKDAPKLDADKYKQIEGNFQKTEDGKTILTPEAFKKVHSAANRGNEGAKALRALAQEILGPKEEKPKQDYKAISTAVAKFAAGKKPTKALTELYFDKDDEGKVTGLKKEIYFSCVGTASRGKDEEAKTFAAAAVAQAKEVWPRPEKTQEQEAPAVDEPKADEPGM
jgi:hypothetical protein